MITVVPSGSAYVVERLGMYRITLSAGVHFLVPFVDRVAFRFSLRPKSDESIDTAITRDNVPVSIRSTVQWQVSDPERAAYATSNVAESLWTLVRTHQREWVSERDWKDIRETTRDLEQDLLHGTAEPVRRIGAKVIAYAVERIEEAR